MTKLDDIAIDGANNLDYICNNTDILSFTPPDTGVYTTVTLTAQSTNLILFNGSILLYKKIIFFNIHINQIII